MKHDPNYDWQYLLKTYKRLVKKNYNVIEVGASNQHRTKDLAKLCRQLTGVEYFKKRLPKNQKNISYIQGNWQCLSNIFPKERFDILISSHTLEHIPNDLLAINQTYKILKPGGIAIINTPNRKRLIRTILEFFTGPKVFPCGEHVREYDYTDLKKLLNKSYFKNDYKIIPVVFGIHSNIRIYLKKFPKFLDKYCNFWQINLYK